MTWSFLIGSGYDTRDKNGIFDKTKIPEEFVAMNIIGELAGPPFFDTNANANRVVFGTH